MTRRPLDAVLSVLAEPVMITDAAGVVTYANPAGVRRFAWDKVIGVPLATRVARKMPEPREQMPVPCDAEATLRARSR